MKRNNQRRSLIMSGSLLHSPTFTIRARQDEGSRADRDMLEALPPMSPPDAILPRSMPIRIVLALAFFLPAAALAADPSMDRAMQLHSGVPRGGGGPGSVRSVGSGHGARPAPASPLRRGRPS